MTVFFAPSKQQVLRNYKDKGIYCRDQKFWSSMSLHNLVRLSRIKTFSLPDYTHFNKASKNDNECHTKLMIGNDIYDRFTMQHFPLRQNMILTTSFFCSRQYILYFVSN
jgi:hypothetical protein